MDRMSNEYPEIVTDPSIMEGQPTIRGTRLTVELLLEQLANGATIQELLEDYPRLTAEGLQAALGYAARILEQETERAHKRAAS